MYFFVNSHTIAATVYLKVVIYYIILFYIIFIYLHGLLGGEHGSRR